MIESPVASAFKAWRVARSRMTASSFVPARLLLAEFRDRLIDA